jgi:hypothetical protein
MLMQKDFDKWNELEGEEYEKIRPKMQRFSPVFQWIDNRMWELEQVMHNQPVGKTTINY